MTIIDDHIRKLIFDHWSSHNLFTLEAIVVDVVFYLLIYIFSFVLNYYFSLLK
jgi:hypothetical protein